ncbi:leucine--tRNA ligase [Marinitenerispora sediminis]|uniref:Leucine--tRNA ligase n=1 Tax=Marinitenerispora sediminis TaxID=1931232 RepID=A0A368T5D8_9ACTN|nr:leucine--tRNA ligase [Marinitenerispora sediminis]RCV50174.1 leucine--tRNA ligase [Marinitenerispora sediminis]RCV54527.1 leucine--tRNA ligase [Marinitenerispora sediminis]RCV56958.1 leucine--tRNA ligase [Marinitenerispora sediminis]
MTAVGGDQVAGDTYDARALQEKWQARWAKENPFAASEDPADDRPRRYVLDMFPYPSGDLHMGHAEAFAMGDVVARYRFQLGENVLHPIGWDSFGLPAENAAIKRDSHPAEWTYANIETQAESFKRYGIAFDWSRRLHTSDPEYYRWNQWLFLRFYERGLAYRKDGLVNWCPNDQTVLANEQVVQGRCERCGTEVVRRSLNQWYFRITEYADRLLDDMERLEGKWPERVLLMQRNWIGRSRGADVRFHIEGRDEPVTVFTTRPDTLFGATFFVVAADAALADELCAPEHRAEFEAYRAGVAKLTDIERQSTERTKTGVFLGRHAINPVNGERIPVWAADYVLADYGHGAIMAVPAHDQRDLDFAKAFDLPVRVVVETGEEDPDITGVATAGEGRLVNSGPLDGLTKTEAIPRIIEILAERGTGDAAVNYRLRDWLLSRQRFWGTPIPIVHCPDCGEVPVPDDQLPVRLPENLRGADLAPKGVSPLAAAADWVNTACPRCGGAALRDTDTMDTFVDSSWYYLRYCSPHTDTAPFDVEQVRRWGPIDQYVGGVEHAILHLLYSRFFTKVLYDMGLVDFTEPFTRLLNQGQVINQGKAMSKSLGNGVDLGKEIDEYGVDAVRLTVVFAGPPEEDIDWADVSPAASLRFLNRAYRVMAQAGAASEPGTDPAAGDLALRKATHQTLDKVTAAVEAQRFNVAIARVMELVTAARRAIDSGPGAADPAVREAAEVIAVTLSLVAPYVAEEGWERLGHTGSVAVGNWRTPDPALLVQESVTCVVQVASKVRDKLQVPPDISAEELERLALASEKVQGFIGERTVRKVVVREPKLVNIVVA